jgi:hypothetical protein
MKFDVKYKLEYNVETLLYSSWETYDSHPERLMIVTHTRRGMNAKRR